MLKNRMIFRMPGRESTPARFEGRQSNVRCRRWTDRVCGFIAATEVTRGSRWCNNCRAHAITRNSTLTLSLCISGKGRRKNGSAHDNDYVKKKIDNTAWCAMLRKLLTCNTRTSAVVFEKPFFRRPTVDRVLAGRRPDTSAPRYPRGVRRMKDDED